MGTSVVPSLISGHSFPFLGQGQVFVQGNLVFICLTPRPWFFLGFRDSYRPFPWIKIKLKIVYVPSQVSPSAYCLP